MENVKYYINCGKEQFNEKNSQKWYLNAWDIKKISIIQIMSFFKGYLLDELKKSHCLEVNLI